MVMERIVKPSNQRIKRVLEKREAKVVENTKTAIFIRGGHTSEVVTEALKDLYQMKKPNAVHYRKKNIMRPFEDQTSLEFFSKKSDASLFVFGSHQKKRPHNLVMGRMFDHQILDMFELGVENYKGLASFKSLKAMLGAKPCLVFSGEPFESEPEYQRLKNMLIDFFRGPIIEKVRLSGLESVISFTAIDGKISFRTYKINLKKSGSKIPRVEIDECGPCADFTLRRTKLASDDLYKKSRKQPIELKPKKKKNVTRDVFGTKHGRIHMQKQDFDSLQLRKVKALKRKAPPSTDDTAAKKMETETNEEES